MKYGACIVLPSCCEMCQVTQYLEVNGSSITKIQCQLCCVYSGDIMNGTAVSKFCVKLYIISQHLGILFYQFILSQFSLAFVYGSIFNYLITCYYALYYVSYCLFIYYCASVWLQLNSLEKLLLTACNIVPGGIVCFFPSYDYEATVFMHLEKSNVIEKMSVKKKV